MSLDLLAEVSAGFAGFAGIIVAIRSRDAALPRLQLVGFLQNCLAVFMLSLFGQFLLELFHESLLVYRWLCGGLAVYHVYIAFIYSFMRTRIVAAAWYEIAILVLTVPVIFLKVAVAAGFMLGLAAQIFYFALLWHMMIAVFLFGQFLLQAANEPVST